MQGKSSTVNLLVKRKSLVFRNALKASKAKRLSFCSSVFLEAGHSGKMGKTKEDTKARVAGRRKEIKERAAEQQYFNGSHDSSILDSSESLSTSLFILL